MRRSILAAAATALLMAAPAGAQTVEFGRDGVRVLPPGYSERYDRRDRYERRREISSRQAARIAREAGMREIDEIRGRRNSYRVIGVDRRGRDLAVDVDRWSGEILRVRRG
ncbi:PepSY domain-containing protein [Chthonobacter rhizosphaerae]|uniref:PepSY domain-containing protein n=1 Tax=Chthonobacter rhizosphaerae TaxID=2735553 RepID=UPI0015EF2372|nr:PepSY domain-containing protein [Chthonobacter rhizosphaerae]